MILRQRQWASNNASGIIEEVGITREYPQGYRVEGTYTASGHEIPTVKGQSFNEICNELGRNLPGFHIITTESEATRQNREAEKQQLQVMLDSGEPMSVSQKSKARAYGLKAKSETTVEQEPVFSAEDNAVFTAWCQREPQRHYLDIDANGQATERAKANLENMTDYILAHKTEAINFSNLDRMWQFLCANGMVQLDSPHRRASSRCWKYTTDRDATLVKPPKQFSDKELAAARHKLVMSGRPQGSRITVEDAAAILGNADLAEALFKEAVNA